MTKEEFEKLLKSVRIATGMDNQEISIDMGYNKGYISQFLSRGKIPDKFIKTLKDRYILNKNKIEYIDFDLGASVKTIQATSEVILSALGEILAKNSGSPVTVVRDQLESLVRQKLSS